MQKIFNTVDDFLKLTCDTFIGYDDVISALRSQTLPTNPSYPPYDVYRENDKFFIRVAISGFSRDEIDITLKENNNLIIRSSVEGSNEKDNKVFLHKGIASRNFTLQFKLLNGCVIDSATMDDGMLLIKIGCISSQSEQKISIGSVSPQYLAE